MAFAPKVSVLMPTYNVEKYIAEAIESILNQTFSDFELIILDDGSTDGSADIAKSFTDNRIVYHHNDVNLGLANNLNVGLRMARGKYIARMDGDDISLPERFQTQIDFLEAHPDIDLCSCGLQMFGTEDTVWVREANPEAVKITMMFYSPVLHATSVWRRESFEKHNLYYDQNAFPAEDYELWSRAVFHCKLVNIPQVLYRYRIHGIQVTKTDDRALLKSKEIQIKYIINSMPFYSVVDAYDFIDNFIYNLGSSLTELDAMKNTMKKFISANKKTKYFNDKRLSKRLVRYYQSKILDYLLQNKSFSFNLLADLNIRQIIKLVYTIL